MTHLLVKKKNEVYVTVYSPEEYVHRELADSGIITIALTKEREGVRGRGTTTP